MYVYELARDLGAQPRELIEHAADLGLGYLVPNSSLTVEQVAAVREAYVRAASPSRGSLFSGGATAQPLATPPPAAAEPPPVAWDAAPIAAEPPPVAPVAWDAPVSPPSPDAPSFDAPLSGAGLGQPLGFAPPGSAPPPPPPSSPAAPPAAPRWDDPQPWDPLPGGITLGGGPVGFDDPVTSRPPVAPAAPEPVREYQPYFRDDDWKPPPPRSTTTRTLVIGVLGVIVVLFATMAIGRELGIIGPGAERHCTLYESPDPDGEGIVEELICLDGYGNEVVREVRTPGADQRGLEFGSNAAGVSTRVVDLDRFCAGAEDFLDFRNGLTAQIADATSVGALGRWYEDNDGFGDGGVEAMIASFGNAGPNTSVVELRDYLDAVREAGRSPDLTQAEVYLAAAEVDHGEAATTVRNFANNNC